MGHQDEEQGIGDLVEGAQRAVLEAILANVPIMVAVLRGEGLECVELQRAGHGERAAGRPFREVLADIATAELERTLRTVLHTGREWRDHGSGLAAVPLPDERGRPDRVVLLRWEPGERKADASTQRELLTAELAATRRLQELSLERDREDDPYALCEQIVDAAAAIARSDFASFQEYVGGASGG